MAETWFEMLDRAKALGKKYAEGGIEAGEKVPEESPLSGEWAGAILPKDVVEQLGGDYDALEDWEVTDILDFWEDGYNSAEWPGQDVVWTDPDGGQEKTGKVFRHYEAGDTVFVKFDDGSEAEVYPHELYPSEL